MSNQAITWAYKQNVSDGMARFVLVTLADRAGDAPEDAPAEVGTRHVTWIGVATLAKLVMLSTRQVQRHLNLLEHAGLIMRVGRRRHNGSWASSYTILAIGDDGPMPFPNPDDTDDATHVTPMSHGHVTPMSPLEPSVVIPQVEPEPQTFRDASHRAGEQIVDAEEVVEADDPRRDCDPPPSEPMNAGKMVAQWIDWCGARGVKLTPQTIKRYGAKFKELLGAGFEPSLIGLALQQMCRDNTVSRVDLLDHYVTRAQTGPERRQRDVRTNQQVRTDDLTDLIAQANALVHARGERPTNRAVSAAMKEIRMGVASVGAMLGAGLRQRELSSA